MSGSGVPGVSQVGKLVGNVASGIGGIVGGGGGPASATETTTDPAKSYTPKARSAGTAQSAGYEGAARDALEDEKRRRYANYAETLLGNIAPKEYAGAMNMAGKAGGV